MKIVCHAALVEETTAAAESLSAEANNLRSNMAFFKTGTTNNIYYVDSAGTKRFRESVPSQQKALLSSPKSSQSSNTEWSEF